MADTPPNPPHEPPSNGLLAEDAPRKGVFPLIWLLVLAALVAFGWTIYNRHASRISPAPTLPASTSPTSPPPNPPPSKP